MNPVVSIILPMKNAVAWVAETIESIQKQTLEEWELVVVDDHSEDDSYISVAHIAETDKRIRIFHNHGHGIIPALEQAFYEVRGTYITRMDADDIMPAYRLKRMVDTLGSLPETAIITGKVRYFSAESVSEGYQKYENWLNERVTRADFYDHIYRECIVASPNWMGRTEEFKKYGLLGKKLDYSFSKTFFENYFQSNNIEASYTNFELPELTKIDEVFNSRIDGLNVTVPYKEAIIPCLDAGLYCEPDNLPLKPDSMNSKHIDLLDFNELPSAVYFRYADFNAHEYAAPHRHPSPRSADSPGRPPPHAPGRSCRCRARPLPAAGAAG